MFARVVVEVIMDQSFPEVIQFLDEKGCMIEQKATYDWLPTTCVIYHMVGHTKEQYVPQEPSKGKENLGSKILTGPKGCTPHPCIHHCSGGNHFAT